MTRNNKYNNVLKAISLLGGVQGLNILLNLIRTKIVAVLLGPTGVGLNGIYNETRELLHSTTNLGLDVSGVRGISKSYEEWQNATDENTRSKCLESIDSEVRLLRSWVLLLALAGMFLCMAFASPLSMFTFDDYDHTWGYVILSPAVAFSTITCGEMAVLKGLRKLRRLATVSVINVSLGLIVTLPIYYMWGIDGVLPALVALFGCIMISTLAFGYKTHKPTFAFGKNNLSKGAVMITIGTNFVVCSIMTHIVGLFIQSFLNKDAGTHMVGLYNSGYTLTMTYAGMIFAAMDQDYFPRLTGVITNKAERSITLIKQQEATMMLITPLLIALIVAIPAIVPLLLSEEFVTMIPMAQATAVGLFFRAVYLSHAYLPLAAGDNRTFLFINIVGAIDLLLVIVGYHHGGLLGMGIALTIQNMIDMLLVMIISKWKYGITLKAGTLIPMVGYLIMIGATYAICTMTEGWTYYIAGAAMVILSTVYAYYRYNKGRKG